MEVIAIAAFAVLFAGFGVKMLVVNQVGKVETKASRAFQKLRVLYGKPVVTEGEDEEGNPVTITTYELSPEGEAVVAEFNGK